MPTIPWEQVKEVVDVVLDLPPDKRISYLDQACPQSAIRRYVESLVLSYDQAGDFLDEPAVVHQSAALAQDGDDSWKGRRVGPYEVVEEIGHGGMGSVYRALRADDQYRKEVAIKIVRSGFDTRLALTRFRAERQILADLDHPNIARLLEGGTTEDGKPYFVMEYIEGEPLDRYCDDHRLTITERLQMFRTVCSAVQYAHQKLVIHRDIKPANIMVSKDGVPKLLDFGIAKILGPESGVGTALQTMPMVRLLTPEYASPEQLRGETITTSSDVYSLGVVLYELLTGHRPYHVSSRQPDDILQIVAATEPEKPSAAVARVEERTDKSGEPLRRTPEIVSSSREGSPERLRRRLSGDLDNIVLTALRKEPKRRYASVEQLSEDLRRHLEGLPVAARKDTFGYRSGKFIKRHAAALGAVAVVLLSLAAGLAVSLREANVARTQRARAEHRFSDVRDLANSLMFGVYDSIEDLPGSTGARKLIVEKALHYLDSLSQESQGDLSLQRELAAAYKRIGDVQGNESSANLGDSAGALTSYRKALEIRRAILAANPDGVVDAVNVAESLRLVANALLLVGDTSGAWKDSQLAVETSEQSEKAEPRNLSVLEELSQDYATEAAILGGNFNLSNLGDTASALAVRQKQVAVRESILNLDPNNSAKRDAFAVSLALMGDQFVLVGQRHAALDYYLRAKTLFEVLAAGSPGRKALDRLQSIYTRIYVVLHGNGDMQEALVTANKALEVARKLSFADPNDVRASISLVIDYSNLADILSSMGHPHSAISASNQGIAMIEQLVGSNPKNGEFPSIQASTYVTGGDIFRRSGDYNRSAHYYRAALVIWARICSQDPDNTDASLDLAGAYNQLGKTLVRKHDLDEAATTFRRALDLAEPQASSGHPNQQSLYSVADSYSGLGETETERAKVARGPQIQTKHLNQARSWFERSLQAWSRIKEPGLLSPNGYDCIAPSEVKQRLAAVNSALGQHS